MLIPYFDWIRYENKCMQCVANKYKYFARLQNVLRNVDTSELIDVNNKIKTHFYWYYILTFKTFKLEGTDISSKCSRIYANYEKVEYIYLSFFYLEN